MSFPVDDPEYYIRDLEPNFYQIAKFNHGSRPETVYIVKNLDRGHGNGKWECDCPRGRFKDCKHITMVQQWEIDGRPSPFEGLFV